MKSDHNYNKFGAFKLIPNSLRILLNRYYQLCFGQNIKIGKNVLIDRSVKLEGYNHVMNSVKLYNSEIGRGTYISSNSKVINTKIGRYCSIGQNFQTNIGVHPTKKFVSTHPSFFSIEPASNFTFVNKQLFDEHKLVSGTSWVCVIGNDVWIGNNVTILDGVIVGDGAIIAAGAIVTKNVEPYSIVGGVPSKKIRMRFSDEEIIKLRNTEWWNWSHEKIRDNAWEFTDIEKFIKEIKVV